jgi:hypothetical protein
MPYLDSMPQDLSDREGAAGLSITANGQSADDD